MRVIGYIIVCILSMQIWVCAQGIMRAPRTDVAGMPAPVLNPGDAVAPQEMTARLNYSDAPLDIVLDDYSEKTGRTLLRAPGLPSPTFTLRSQGALTISEYLRAVETVLTMHGVGLVEFGDNFMRVVPIAAVRKEGMEINEALPEGVVLDSTGMMISQMVELKHIDIQEATKAIEPLRNEKGQINAFERTNSIMITDYAANINRMLQVLRMLDQPIVAREEPNIIQIRFAKAADIKQRLEQIIAESQKEQQKSAPRQRSSGSPGVEPTTTTRNTPAGVIRPSSVRNRSADNNDSPDAVNQMLIAEAERGIIRGKVQIIADDRTNLLIIITRPENMAFFERIVAVLDVETSPDVVVDVVRLEYADAEQIASMLNDLIGATSRDDSPVAPGGPDGEGRESRRLAEVEAALRRTERDLAAAQKSSVGELSKENVKILSDQRTNSLILMASKSDVATIRDIIRDMDRMLSQVLIEAVILEVSLGDSLDTGVSWVQEALTTYTKNNRGQSSPILSFAGGGGGSTDMTPRDATSIRDTAALTRSGLGYFFTLFDLNVNAVIQASATDSRSRVVSTPALLTTDNTEATLSSTERIYVFEGTTFVGTATDSRTARYRQEDVGLTLTVKPQINENHVVMMEIKQEISEPGDTTNTDTENLAGQRISINRKIEASIAVKSGQTIVLGGQVRETDSRNRTKIPLLGDIPVVGRLFNSDSRANGRTETIVFITPYVLDTPDKVAAETRRRRDSLNLEGMWKKGWSGSELADPPGYQRPLPRFDRDAKRPTALNMQRKRVDPKQVTVPVTQDDDVSAFIAEQRRRLREAFGEEEARP